MEMIGQSRAERLLALKAAALSTTYVSLGTRRTTSPHEFYRYPARFTPDFARTAIEAFSQPGDLVVDPFVGGGTTAIEAMMTGRRSVVADINPLATFLTRVKTTPLDAAQADEVRRWLRRLAWTTKLDRTAPSTDVWEKAGYFRHMDTATTWRLAKLIRLALGAITSDDPVVESFCRCIVLRTGQWALDMREKVPTTTEFRRAMVNDGIAMVESALYFATQLPRPFYPPVISDEGVPGLSSHAALSAGKPVALVVTSPPYPGVYVNYHRWKLLGRLEIRTPYWIANEQDGNGLSYYTMSARAEPTLRDYFQQLTHAYSDIAAMLDAGSALVQLVGFSDPADQLDRYLLAMDEAGLVEEKLPEFATAEDGRLWRTVPNRRWWNVARSKENAAPNTGREVVLLHRRRTQIS